MPPLPLAGRAVRPRFGPAVAARPATSRAGPSRWTHRVGVLLEKVPQRRPAGAALAERGCRRSGIHASVRFALALRSVGCVKRMRRRTASCGHGTLASRHRRPAPGATQPARSASATIPAGAAHLLPLPSGERAGVRGSHTHRPHGVPSSLRQPRSCARTPRRSWAPNISTGLLPIRRARRPPAAVTRNTGRQSPNMGRQTSWPSEGRFHDAPRALFALFRERTGRAAARTGVFSAATRRENNLRQNRGTSPVRAVYRSKWLGGGYGGI